MKKWEDIIKDKLEEPDGALPENVFAEFHARLDGALPAPAQKRFPLVWVVAAAAAACLAAVLFLRHSSSPDDGIQIIQQPAAPLATVVDSTEVAVKEALLTQQLVAQAVMPGAVRRPAAREEKMEKDVKAEEVAVENVGSSESVENEKKEEITEPSERVEEYNKGITSVDLVKPSLAPISIAVPVAGAVGGGIVAASLLATAKINLKEVSVSEPQIDYRQVRAEYLRTIDELSGKGSTPGPAIGVEDDPVTGHKHCLPLKAGLSARIPVSDRLYITTGLEYALYPSTFVFSQAGEKKQYAHYMGIPARLDWSIASGRWLDVYLGGGIEGSFGLGATFDGIRVRNKDLNLSFLGAGGLQLNLTKNLGLYVEPQVSWTIPIRTQGLETYRSEHPFMFSVGTGLRITFGK